MPELHGVLLNRKKFNTCVQVRACVSVCFAGTDALRTFAALVCFWWFMVVRFRGLGLVCVLHRSRIAAKQHMRGVTIGSGL